MARISEAAKLEAELIEATKDGEVSTEDHLKELVLDLRKTVRKLTK
jgi:hypothetical protein